jgi:superfamily II DNA or RNA helicase
MENGFIYGRINYESSINNCCKIGITQNIPCREISYITTEIYRGKWNFIINVYKKEYAINIEKKIKKDLEKFNFYQGAGTEFFKNSDLLNKIIGIIKKMNINFHILNDDEIKKLNKKFYERSMNEIIKDIKKYESNLINKKNNEKSRYIEKHFEMNSNFKLYNYQDYILNKSINILKSNKKGLLLWACGLGKTLFSLKIAEKLKCKNILIGAPNKNLSLQFYNEIKKFTSHIPILFQSKVNIEEIKKILQKNDVNIIITTYHSCYKLLDINKKIDIKIGDEAHHLSNKFNENEKNFIKFHDIATNYSLFMTATSKLCDDISMDNEDYFGKIIDKKSIKWSITNNKICNYKIISIQNNIENLDQIYQNIKLKINNIDDDIDLKKLFLSSFATLKTIEDKISKKTLIYTNSIKTAQIVYKIINYLLVSDFFIIKDIYNNSISSKSENIDINEEIEKFKKAKYGIISCVQIFGEGFNLPILDSVVVAENMESNIRIVQYLLRPTRLYFDKEFAKIIIPTNSNMIDNNLKNIIKKMKFEDDIIDQKIESYSIISKKYENIDSKKK